jgi:hypothetical protein
MGLHGLEQGYLYLAFYPVKVICRELNEILFISPLSFPWNYGLYIVFKI